MRNWVSKIQGKQDENGNGNNPWKMLDKGHHAIQYTGWILKHDVSLQHCLDPFNKND